MQTGFLDLVRTRRSVRRYRPDPVPPELLTYALDAARLAPSACNCQPWRFTVADRPEIIARLCREAMGAPLPNAWAVEAPVIIALSVVFAPLVHTAGMVVKGIDYRLIDAGIAGEHFCLAAAEQGLGTCWIGWFKAAAVRRILNIPRTAKIVALITLGYPGDEDGVQQPRRLRLDEISNVGPHVN
ncbi:MAG: nitroreductase family protein [Planctomycetota bacterium]